MPTSKATSYDEYRDEDAAMRDRYVTGQTQERETTILARVVRTVSVSMSFAEMDTLIGTFGRARSELTTGELRILDEFAQSVDAIR